MSSYTQLLTVIYVFVLFWSNTCVNGSMKWCLPGAEVNLTGVSPDFSGYHSKYGLSFPPNATLVKNGETVGCPCKFLTCVQSCCPFGYATHKNRCVEDTLTPSFVARFPNDSTELPSWRKDGPKIFSDRSQYVYIFPTHEFISVHSVKLAQVTDILEDGSFRRGSVKFDLGAYCILRPTNALNFGMISFARFSAVSFGICLICASATFIIYTIISELKNLRGSILRCYLASYIIFLFLFVIWITVTNFPTGLSSFKQAVVVLICSFGMLYFGIACVFWMSVMSYDTWKVFGRFEPIQHVHTRQMEKKKFFWYSVYAWGVSFVLFVIAKCGIWVVALYGDYQNDTEKWVMFAILLGPVVIIIICNTYFYGSTALMIKRRKNELASLVDGVNKHHKEHHVWFNLYLRLYVIMGGAAILWIPLWYVDVRVYPKFVVIVEALQGVLIFITCVWRDEVKRYFSGLYNRMLHTLAHLLRRNSTPA